jgi:transposase
MAKKRPLENHLETAELAQRYRGARDPVERAHDQIIWLLSQGRSTGEVATVTGSSRSWIRRIVRRYNERGTAGLGDRRQQNRGGAARALLGPQRREELDAALPAPPPDGGRWSSRKVAAWIAHRTGRPTGVQRGWEDLRRFGSTPPVPRPAHATADPDQQEHFRNHAAGGSHR